MHDDLFQISELGYLDRLVEDAVREAVLTDALVQASSRIGSLIEQRVQLSEPVEFARIEELLGQPIPEAA